MKWTSNTGNTVEILPWMDKGFKLISLDCKESIGGKEACGRVEMVYIPDREDNNSKMITDESEVTIKLGTVKSGVRLIIKGIITDRSYLKNLFTFEFSCFPRLDFWTHRGTLVSTNIKDAIINLWGDKKTIDFRGTESDLPDGIVFSQASKYDYNYLQVLCESYKKNTIFAFGLEGLLIKDLVGIDSANNKEPNWVIMGNTPDAIQDLGIEEDRFELTYDPKLYMSPEDPWGDEEDSVKSKYWGVTTFDNTYRLTGKDESLLRENKFWNDKIYNSYMYNQIRLKHTVSLQMYRLGDVVKYYRAGEKDKIPWKTYIISGIRYHYRVEPSPGTNANPEEFPFSLDYTLHCIEEDGEIMSTKDPVRK